LLGFFMFAGIAYSMATNHGCVADAARRVHARHLYAPLTRLDASRAEYGVKHKLIAAAHAAEQRLHSMEKAAVDALIPPTAARWPLFLFLAAACLCLLLSAICHTLCCVNNIAPWIWRVDYAGIASLIGASFFPPVYYSFLCQSLWMRIYLGTITVGCIATLIVSLAPKFGGPAWRVVRAATFAALGSSGIVPITHQFLYYLSRGQPMPRPLAHATCLELLMGFLYLLGALLYAKRWPERQFPYVFDYALNSHNLFHLLVVAAALTHVDASLVLLAWRDHHTDCAA